MPFRATCDIDVAWVRLIKDHPDRFMIGSDERYSEPCRSCKLVKRVAWSRRWIDLLPQDIARKIAIQNPVRIYHLAIKR